MWRSLRRWKDERETHKLQGELGTRIPHLRGEIRPARCGTACKTKKKKRKRGATRGLPRRSPILVLLSPKHALQRGSDGIRSISAGMIAPIPSCALKSYMRPPESRSTFAHSAGHNLSYDRPNEAIFTPFERRERDAQITNGARDENPSPSR